MSTLVEIKDAAARLPAEQRTELITWLCRRLSAKPERACHVERSETSLTVSFASVQGE